MRRWYVWAPISTALIALLVWRTRPWEELDLVASLDQRLLVVAIGLNAVVIVMWAVRSQRLLRAVGWSFSVAELMPVTAFANTVSSLTPASSGEILRAVVLRRLYGVPYDRSTAVIIVERFYALWLMGVSAVAAAAGTLVAFPAWAIGPAWIVALGVMFLPTVLYLTRVSPGRFISRAMGPVGNRPSRWRRAGTYLVSVDDHLRAILVDPARAVYFALATAVIFAMFTAQLWLVLASLGTSVSPIGLWSAFGLATIAGVASALPFGLGATDVVLVVGLGLLGVSPPIAAASTLLLRMVGTLPAGLAGTASWIVLSRRPGSASGARVEMETPEVRD
jgi:uncharacterized protein (TIRG00374 family)